MQDNLAFANLRTVGMPGVLPHLNGPNSHVGHSSFHPPCSFRIFMAEISYMVFRIISDLTNLCGVRNCRSWTFFVRLANYISPAYPNSWSNPVLPPFTQSTLKWAWRGVVQQHLYGSRARVGSIYPPPHPRQVETLMKRAIVHVPPLESRPDNALQNI